MGIFEKLKKATNFIIGSGAKLQIEQLEKNVSEGIIPLKVRCQISDSEVNVSNIYLKVRAVERVEVEDYDFNHGDGNTYRENIYREHETHQQKLIIGKAQTLQANSTHEWNIELPIPESKYGTYKGLNASHDWEVFAGLDTSGNDPDSGWVEIIVYN